MKMTELYPSNYLKKEDVQYPIQAVIKAVVQEEISGDGIKELKPIVYFAGNVKQMVLNKGNALAIAEAYGDDSAAWHGKTVEIYVDPAVTFAGKRVGGLRVRVPLTARAAPANGLWDVYDGREQRFKLTADEVRLFLANVSAPSALIRIKPAGAGRDQAKSPDEWGFAVAVGHDDDEIPF